ncbi:MAG: cupin domain-containing protein [Undibacterium sp.]|nr:cupin domain-containing protein [Opitutaceae bacterium]
MPSLKLADVPWLEQRSPSGKFHSFCQNISVALGAPRNAGLSHGGHPFDVQIRRVPPGTAVCPFHSHLAQWEFFIIRAGTGTVRVGDETHAVKPGDFFVHPPGEPHQLINSGSSHLEVLIVADNPPLDAFHYPDSKKWGLRPPGIYFRNTPADYFDGEEPPAPDAPPYQPSGSPPAPALTPFAQRKSNLDDLAWEIWQSPKKKYRADFAQLSETIGAQRNTPTGLGGHPFDLELGRVPPGYCGCPFHSHVTQWEFYIFLHGTAAFRTPAGTTEVGPDDIVLTPPGAAHQFTNTGLDDLHYLLVADNPIYDIYHYPDSNKWGLREPRKFFRATDVDYWDGEE